MRNRRNTRSVSAIFLTQISNEQLPVLESAKKKKNLYTNAHPEKPGLHFSPHMPLHMRLIRHALRFMIFTLFRVQVAGKENLPGGSYIALANHLRWIDPLLLLAVLPAAPRVYFIGAQQAFQTRWKIWLMKTYDAWIPANRGAYWMGKDVFALPLRVLKSGAVLAFFPEGDSGSREGELMPLKRGIGHFVLRADYPIVPVALSGTLELYWHKPIKVILGKPFRVDVKNLPHHAAIDAAVAQVTQQLQENLPPYQEPVVDKKRMRFLSDLMDRI